MTIHRIFSFLFTIPLFVPSLAHAAPTVSADLDMGTSTDRTAVARQIGVPGFLAAPLYVVGFTLRAGYRFDLGSFFLLPELGGGYVAERFVPEPGGGATTGSLGGRSVSRFFVG